MGSFSYLSTYLDRLLVHLLEIDSSSFGIDYIILVVIIMYES